MGALDRLPTLQEQQQTRRAVPKYAIPSRLDEKAATDTNDARLLRDCAQTVRLRDGGKCRACHVKTLVTLELCARRGECHHIVSRTCRAVRYDSRNCVHVCARCHHLLTTHRLFIVGKASQMFTAGRAGKSYLNGEEALTFTAKRPETAA